MDTVSVIIPSYNRFKYLLNAIKSVKNQTYKNIDIIVINDCSTEKEYYTFNFKKEFGNRIYILNLPKNSKDIFGDICGGGNSRNIGMMLTCSKYIAFLDDDDFFMPNKIEKQIEAMKNTNCSISCTEAYYGHGIYNNNMIYKNWHYEGFYWDELINIFKNKTELLNNMYKQEINIWDEKEINFHNCTCGGSSILIERNLIDKAGYFPLMKYGEDWVYWEKLIKYSKCVYIREPLVYIDAQSK